jgi:hypothetical protein
MFRERRNLYRLLHVQPEAPEAVIKAAYRALMSTLRMHPDLGGDGDVAARLNHAYAVLSDPERRRAYDLSLKRSAPASSAARSPPAPPTQAAQAAPARGATAPAPPADLGAWLRARQCPLCARAFAFAGRPQADQRCLACEAPLAPAPAAGSAKSELIGRRHGERFARDMPAELHLQGGGGVQAARLRNLSMEGLSFVSPVVVVASTPLRLVTASFDAVAWCLACRRTTAGLVVHARLLTLQLHRGTRGVYVSAQA